MKNYDFFHPFRWDWRIQEFHTMDFLMKWVTEIFVSLFNVQASTANKCHVLLYEVAEQVHNHWNRYRTIFSSSNKIYWFLLTRNTVRLLKCIINIQYRKNSNTSFACEWVLLSVWFVNWQINVFPFKRARKGDWKSFIFFL